MAKLKLTYNAAGGTSAAATGSASSTAPSTPIVVDDDSSSAASTSRKRPRKKSIGSSSRPVSGSSRPASDVDDAQTMLSDDHDAAETQEDLEFAYRSPGESTDSAGGGDGFGASADEDDEDDVAAALRRKKANKPAKKGKGRSTRSSGKTGLKAKLVLSAASRKLYSDAADNAGSIVRMPPTASDTSSLVSSLFPPNADAAYLPLKTDHASRPLYIAPSYPPFIILEAFHPLSLQAQDFLTAIAEPVSRPKHIHEYKLTKHSLYAAVSIGLEPEDIIAVLSRLSKVRIPPETIEYIREATKSFGKVRLVLKDTKYFVESGYADTLRLLLRDKAIRGARVTEEGAEDADLETASAPKQSSLVIPGTKYAGAGAAGGHVTDGGIEQAAGADGQQAAAAADADGMFTAIVGLDADEEAEDDINVHRFEIKADEMENVKKRCNELEYPMLQEYDFAADSVNVNLEIALKPQTQIRPYQEKALRKMFSNEWVLESDRSVLGADGRLQSRAIRHHRITLRCWQDARRYRGCAHDSQVMSRAMYIRRLSHAMESRVPEVDKHGRTRHRGVHI